MAIAINVDLGPVQIGQALGFQIGFGDRGEDERSFRIRSDRVPEDDPLVGQSPDELAIGREEDVERSPLTDLLGELDELDAIELAEPAAQLRTGHVVEVLEGQVLGLLQAARLSADLGRDAELLELLHGGHGLGSRGRLGLGLWGNYVELLEEAGVVLELVGEGLGVLRGGLGGGGEFVVQPISTVHCRRPRRRCRGAGVPD